MDVEKFRRKYLETANSMPKEDDDDPNPLRKKYLSWLRAEQSKSRKAAKTVNKLKASEIAELERESSSSYPVNRTKEEAAFEMKTEESGETYIFDPDQGYQPVNVKQRSPDFIEIDPELKLKFKFFQFGDTVYDRDGYFLFRVPGLG